MESHPPHPPHPHPEPESLRLAIGGMSCASCVSHVEKALRKVDGVETASVNLATEKATVKVRPGVSAETLVRAVEGAGYGARLERPEGHAHLEDPKDNPRWKVVAAGLFTLPLVLPMAGMPFGYHASLSPIAQGALASVVQFYFGLRFYRASLSALRAKTANMDLLVALGTTAAYGLSVYGLLRSGEAPLYFESAAVVTTLVLLGKHLEARAKIRTTATIRALQSLRPERARVIRLGKESEQHPEEAQPRLLRRPGVLAGERQRPARLGDAGPGAQGRGVRRQLFGRDEIALPEHSA